MLARGHAGLAAAADDVVRAGGEAPTVPVDVSDGDAVEAARVPRRGSVRPQSTCG